MFTRIRLILRLLHPLEWASVLARPLSWLRDSIVVNDCGVIIIIIIYRWRAGRRGIANLIGLASQRWARIARPHDGPVIIVTRRRLVAAPIDLSLRRRRAHLHLVLLLLLLLLKSLLLLLLLVLQIRMAHAMGPARHLVLEILLRCRYRGDVLLVLVVSGRGRHGVGMPVAVPRALLAVCRPKVLLVLMLLGMLRQVVLLLLLRRLWLLVMLLLLLGSVLAVMHRSRCCHGRELVRMAGGQLTGGDLVGRDRGRDRLLDRRRLLHTRAVHQRGVIRHHVTYVCHPEIVPFSHPRGRRGARLRDSRLH